jgi:hypothetical protein
VLNRNDRYSFNLERGDTIKLAAGTIAYLANRDDKEELRVLDLVIPVNRPGQFQVIHKLTFSHITNIGLQPHISKISSLTIVCS